MSEIKNLFDAKEANVVIERIEKLDANTNALWGKMDVSQMLAHCCVTYEYVYEDKYAKPKGVKKFLLKSFLKPFVVGERAYKKNTRTGPDFLKTNEYSFETEKARLIAYIRRTQELGGDHFDGKDSHSFGALSEKEWNTMFYKHLDHHLGQFGV